MASDLTKEERRILTAVDTGEATQGERSAFRALLQTGLLTQTRVNAAFSRLALTPAGRAALQAKEPSNGQ